MYLVYRVGKKILFTLVIRIALPIHKTAAHKIHTRLYRLIILYICIPHISHIQRIRAIIVYDKRELIPDMPHKGKAAREEEKSSKKNTYLFSYIINFL